MKNYKVVFHPLALEEYQKSFVWYEMQQKGLGVRFEEAIGAVIEKINTHPAYYSYSRKPYREASVSHFPFVIVYKVSNRKLEIYIASIFHTRKSTKRKHR